ncbi:unnamed protein product [Protopolystoma xenopodis]|uniref:Uncharacterized protein n=1 Tax=Protopolystoma xenopodis TaxID=117903 RepID=A0A3S5B854_9PLAT|nr:unnamed protein product [Protopolystoma xenopodis]
MLISVVRVLPTPWPPETTKPLLSNRFPSVVKLCRIARESELERATVCCEHDR